MSLYVISGVTGMTGNELARQLLVRGDEVIGFDNLFASSIATIADIIDAPGFAFYPYDLNNPAQMAQIGRFVSERRKKGDRIAHINCAAVVHTEHFYHVNETFDTNVVGMRFSSTKRLKCMLIVLSTVRHLRSTA